MKVLHIGKYYFPFFGGIEKVIQELVECNHYQSHVSALVLSHHFSSKKSTSIDKLNGVEIRKVSVLGRLSYAPIAPFFLNELNKAISDFSPDIIHIHLPNVSAFACLLSSKAKSIPWVIHWHSDVIGAVPDIAIRCLYPFYKVFENALLNRAKKIIVTSPPYLAHSNALVPYRGKCSVIPIGIRDSLIKKPVDNTTTSRLKLLIIGRLTYYKGHRLLLEAISLLDQSFDVHLTIVGEGELKSSLVNFVKLNNLQNKVSFLGRLSTNELQQQLANCDLVCLPSIEKTEAFGVVLLEAAMHSKASLVTDVEGSGMSWVVRNNITGLIAKNNDVQNLKKLLETACSEVSKLSEMGIQARNRFDTLFNIEMVSKEYLKLYEECLRD